MNKKAIIAVISIAATALGIYIYRRLSAEEKAEVRQKTHHLTDVFSRAKNMAQSAN